MKITTTTTPATFMSPEIKTVKLDSIPTPEQIDSIWENNEGCIMEF